MIVKPTLISIGMALALCACSTAKADTSESHALTDHVVVSLENYTLAETPTVQSVQQFAAEHEHDAAELEARGMVRGISAMFGPANPEIVGHAMSVAEEFKTSMQAEAEADRLFSENSEPPPGATVEALDIDGIPGVQAVLINGELDGVNATGVEIVFVHGAVLHEIFALGADPLVSVEAITDATTDLYNAIAGHPAR